MKMRLPLYPLFMSFICCSSAATAKKNMIFDFGGVLFLPDKRVSFQHLGVLNIAELAIRQIQVSILIRHGLHAALSKDLLKTFSI